MKVKLIEATQNLTTGFNMGKFMLLRPDNREWRRASILYEKTVNIKASLLRVCGWDNHLLIVFDLQTGEGAQFLPGGSARYDLNKHRIWVCPMFEPFLEWLYTQDLTDLSKLPDVVELPKAEPQMTGYRRPGPEVSKI